MPRNHRPMHPPGAVGIEPESCDIVARVGERNAVARAILRVGAPVNGHVARLRNLDRVINQSECQLGAARPLSIETKSDASYLVALSMSFALIPTMISATS